MINTALLFIMLQCPQTILVNNTGVDWTVRDKENLAISKTRCVVHYSDAPCLKKFTKISFQNYHAICGVGK